jgi:vacuolar iron transporter family protein
VRRVFSVLQNGVQLYEDFLKGVPMQTLRDDVRQKILNFQRDEITEYHIYSRLAKRIKSPENAKIMEHIANDELRHYNEWKGHSGQEVPPNWLKVWWYYIISIVFGYTFGIKLMERSEEQAQKHYADIIPVISDAARIQHEEDVHEEQLIAMLNEERLEYAGSVVLGLNDALVELTGALAGLTLALQNTKLIALSGLITGIAAAMSMAASEYLSTRSEDTGKHPVRAAVYTGIAYIVTVFLLILPYLLFENYFFNLGWALVTAAIIIAVFNYYISVAKDEPFRERFLEMAGLSFGVAVFSFIIGYLIRIWLGIEI